MFSDVPNLVSVFGYSNTSWTLKSDLIREYACRVLEYMKQSRMRRATAASGSRRRALRSSSGYVQRSHSPVPATRLEEAAVAAASELRPRVGLRWTQRARVLESCARRAADRNRDVASLKIPPSPRADPPP